MADLFQFFRSTWTRMVGTPPSQPSPIPLQKPTKPLTTTEQTDWCLVGNIVEEHAFGESKEMLRGSKHFTPGTKVYCLPPQWGDGYEKVVAVGIARGSRRWITVVLPSRLITNWRAKVVYKPAVLRRLRAGFNGHKLQWQSREEVESYLEFLRSSRGGG